MAGAMAAQQGGMAAIMATELVALYCTVRYVPLAMHTYVSAPAMVLWASSVWCWC
jgi:hypothetical protein